MSGPVTRKRTKKREQHGEVSCDHDTTNGNNRAGPASRGDPQSPTAQIALAKAKSELELLKLKVSSQQGKIKDLEEERDFLRKQLTQVNKNIEEKEDNEFKRKKKTVATDSSSFDSSESSSDSVSTDSSLEKKKKKRLKERQKKKEKKKNKEKKGITFHRVGGPAEVIRRYEKVLAIYTQGSTMAKAFQKYGVDRNTIAKTASIAELFVAAPEKYHQLHGEREKKEKVLDFAKKCNDEIASDQSIAEKICHLKLEGKLLPIQKK